MIEEAEIVAARDAARGFSGLVARLAGGELSKVVVMHRNRPTAVLLSWAEYRRLVDAKEPDS